MDDRASVPGRVPRWIQLCRWLNGSRVCSVADCIELTAPATPHCERHIRAFRTELAGRCCREPSCVAARVDDEELCPHHLELELARRVQPFARWNPRPLVPGARSQIRK